MEHEYGVCNLPIVPMRTDPSHRSEMCSQLLFGDHFTILERTDEWLRIVTAHDEYEGWIDHKQFTGIELPAFVALHDLASILGLSVYHTLTKPATHEKIQLLAGSGIPHAVDGLFYLGETRYKMEVPVVRPSSDNFRERVKDAAMFYLNAPYLWGGKSIFGIDCSGFTQMVFRQFGIRLKRDAWMQAEDGELVAFLQEAAAGDLAFFDNEDGKIVHVGIMLDNERIIHASGRVKIDMIDNQGIFSSDLKRYTHKLRIVKRYKR